MMSGGAPKMSKRAKHIASKGLHDEEDSTNPPPSKPAQWDVATFQPTYIGEETMANAPVVIILTEEGNHTKVKDVPHGPYHQADQTAFSWDATLGSKLGENVTTGDQCTRGEGAGIGGGGAGKGDAKTTGGDGGIGDNMDEGIGEGGGAGGDGGSGDGNTGYTNEDGDGVDAEGGGDDEEANNEDKNYDSDPQDHNPPKKAMDPTKLYYPCIPMCDAKMGDKMDTHEVCRNILEHFSIPTESLKWTDMKDQVLMNKYDILSTQITLAKMG